LNGNGSPDVAIGIDGHNVSVLLNSADGSLRKRSDYRTGPSENGWGPRSVSIGDLNGDRKLDLVTVKSASVSVLLNTTRG
jgi:FG-GAP-like repeat